MSTVALLGAGFLGSFIAPTIIPFFKKFVIIDRDYVSIENYDNSLYPRGMQNKKKVNALGFLLEILSGKEVVLFHRDIRSTKDLEKAFKVAPWDLGIVTFDNVNSRKIALEFAIEKGISTIFAGVSVNYAYVTWDSAVKLPVSDEEIKEEVSRIRDVCSRVEFRPLAPLVASLVTVSLLEYRTSRRKVSHIVRIDKGLVQTASFRVE